MYERKLTCLPAGCYETYLSLSGSTSTKPSTMMSIPQCDVFVAPLRISQIFCIEESYIETFEKNNTSDFDSLELKNSNLVPVFPENSCRSLCDLKSHIKFDAVLSEPQVSYICRYMYMYMHIYICICIYTCIYICI
jgi:hypothetical protein